MDDNSNTMRSRRIAMLIDGDNAQPSLIGNMLAEASKYGTVIIRRIYGDWTTANMNGWKETLNNFAVQPIQQFRYTVGKNATDSAMIIDAMDILYQGGVEGFCLVSSDSDYTRLATRIREKGFYVMGIGKKSTPRAFVNACDVFVFTENLLPESTHRQKTSESKKTNGGGASKEAEPPSEPLPLLKQAFDLAVQDDGWAFLGVMGTHLRQLDPSFDPRTYGYKQLSALVKAYTRVFDLKMGKKGDGTFNVYVRLKE
ncbi:MAG: NYN domain-containing protein [Chloroflexi bacterium]|nr:NYN domain-containing protein [Chloroflexota bacterium]